MLLLYVHSSSQRELLYAVYALVSGPLAGAIIMWNCSLVLHDIDRFTSLFIHFVPPLVCYTLRWHGLGLALPAPTLWQTVVPALGMYLYWQMAYIAKTEVFDRYVCAWAAASALRALAHTLIATDSARLLAIVSTATC